MSADSFARMVVETMLAKDEAARQRGFQLGAVSAGAAEFDLSISAKELNALGVCDGGVIFALAEAAFLYAANSHNRRCVSQSASISYLAQAKAGDVLRASTRELSRLGRSGVYAVEVRNQHGILIAELRGQSRKVRGEWVQSFAP